VIYDKLMFDERQSNFNILATIIISVRGRKGKTIV